eukprot:245144-Hanusia_phi.AAC.2
MPALVSLCFPLQELQSQDLKARKEENFLAKGNSSLPSRRHSNSFELRIFIQSLSLKNLLLLPAADEMLCPCPLPASPPELLLLLLLLFLFLTCRPPRTFSAKSWSRSAPRLGAPEQGGSHNGRVVATRRRNFLSCQRKSFSLEQACATCVPGVDDHLNNVLVSNLDRNLSRFR